MGAIKWVKINRYVDDYQPFIERAVVVTGCCCGAIAECPPNSPPVSPRRAACWIGFGEVLRQKHYNLQT
jgi:hypothetical protein